MNTELKHLNDGDQWILAEDIPDIDFQFSQIWLSSFVNDLEKTVGRNYSKILSVYHGTNLKFYYGERDSFAFAEHLLHLICDTPDFGRKINSEIRRLSDLFKNECHELSPTRLASMSNVELAEIYQKWDTIHTELYTWGWLPNAVDMFHGNLTNWIRQQLMGVLPEDEVNAAIVLVTVSPKKSVVQQEHESLLNLAAMKQESASNEAFEASLEAHQTSFFYLKHLWLGKDGVYDTTYYRSAIDDILTSGKNARQRLAEEHDFIQEQLKKRSELIARFANKPQIIEIFDIYADFAVTKLHRRDAQLFWAYQMDAVFAQLAKRLGITAHEARFLLPHEVADGLLNAFSQEHKQEISRRAGYCVYYAEKSHEILETGEDAKRMESQIVEATIGDIQEIRGQTACVGRAVGKARIVNSIGEMAKMQRGDILISIATNPDIVPAMKLAGAIVTEQGGITSHAAIVSRELNVPCIIGTKIATKVLRDDDEVEVDANKGIVKVLKRAN